MPVRSPLPADLFSAAQSRELDRRAIEEHGLPGYTLMSRAGQALFDALRARWPEARRLAVVCGPGNNGGDGYVVARLARVAGFSVRVASLTAEEQLTGDALRAAREWRAYGGETHPFAARPLGEAEVVVDALFGTGLERPLEGEWRAAVEAINASGAAVAAADIPSGLCADTGAVLGCAVRADLTVSFIALKPGLLTAEGPDHVGELRFHDLEVAPEVYAGMAPAARRVAGLEGRLAPRRRGAHKGECGHVLVVGGDAGFGGAARLTAEAAGRCGAGLLSLATHPHHAAVVGAMRPEIMSHAVADAEALAPLLERATVVAVGPGLGRGAWGRALLARVLESGLPLVVDADALNLLAENHWRSGQWVITPHPGEAARLLESDVATVQRDRFAAVGELQARYGGVALLKGAGTLVAAEGETTAVIHAGNPGMASGGMGDLLTGVTAALVAQGLPLFAAACGAAWLHGAAADRAAADGERGTLASDLLPHLRRLANPEGGHHG